MAGVLVVIALASAYVLSRPDLLAALGYDLARARLVTGMVVAGTAADPLVYVSSSDPRAGGGEGGDVLSLDTNSGVISVLRRNGSGWERRDLVRGLPRSRERHATNGMFLDARTEVLYVAQGSNTNAGAPSTYFGGLPEYALSGAILSVDLRRIGERTYDLPTLDGDGDEPFGGRGGANQAVLVPGGPVTVFAPGYRNPYDVVLTRAGRVYTVQNGGNAGWGAPPHGEGADGRCTNAVKEGGRRDEDTLHLVQPRSYGGHPNPTRANRANVFDGRSPVARPSPHECDYLSASERNPLATFEASTNGITEFEASVFGGRLNGNLVIASFDRNVYALELDEDGDRVVGRRVLATLDVPLDVTAQGDDDVFPGTIWVAQYDTGVFGERTSTIGALEPVGAERGRRWRTLAGPGTERQEVSYVMLDGKLYLAGGGTRHEVYDPRTNRWRELAPLPRALDHIQGVALGGRIYYIGGLAAWPEPAVGTVYVYDPASDRFSQAQPMPRPRGAGGVAAFGGRIYYAGGLHQGAAVSWFDEYDPVRNAWRQLPDMPRARDHFQAVVVDGRLFALGGRDSEIGRELAASDAFSFENGRWQTGLAPIPTLRGGFAAAVVGEKILVIGGETSERALATVEVYDVGRDSWRAAEPLPEPRHGIQAASCGGAVYIAAGGADTGGEQPTRSHYAYRYAGEDVCREDAADGDVARRPAFRFFPLRGSSSFHPTSLQFGPDGKLYVAQQDGVVKRYTITRRSSGYDVLETETIDAIQRIPNHDDDGRVVTDPRATLAFLRERLGL